MRGEAPYVVGADGARSVVRNALGFTFDGHIDDAISFVADCEIDAPLESDVMHYFTEGDRRLAFIPLASGKRLFKLSGNAPAALVLGSDLRTKTASLEARAKSVLSKSCKIRAIRNVTTYRVSSRLASRFASRRCIETRLS
ncbi:FAD-dependent monooxygenase [Mesorhizobium sp.]|uniref:FAD-dependent monooxygenase n=1 Tax=Mesorhizobium sp. TaxID=1871066 RepID=UPI000FE82A2D|nr:FAD-dependent monooxygenase [Mesorhizobium sp.]RWC64019.1 MAG: hypothetical protein EOS29_13420 [Mesorhizobium sp.]RWC64152.1 MAG: hypothetical protein EOS56_00065 [Mesorhizobium sp.]